MDIHEILSSAGWPTEAIPIAKAIIKAESSGNPRAYNGGGRDDSYGLFQINMLHDLGRERRRRWNLTSNEDLYDPITNAKVALDLYKSRGGFQDWSTFNSGAYKKFLSEPDNSNGPTGNTSSEMNILDLLQSDPQSQQNLPDNITLPGLAESSANSKRVLPLALMAMLSGDEPTMAFGKLLTQTLGQQNLVPSGGGTILDQGSGTIYQNPYIQDQLSRKIAEDNFSRKVALANTMSLMQGRLNTANRADQAAEELQKYREAKLAMEQQRLNNELLKNNEPRALAPTQVKDIAEKLKILKGVLNTGQEWSPEIAGFAGGIGPLQDLGMQAANRVGATGLVPEAAKKAADFYAKYKNTYELAARKGIFGSALTSTEAPQWQAATLTPGIDFKLGQDRIQTLQELAKDNVRALIAGYGNHPDIANMISEVGLNPDLSLNQAQTTPPLNTPALMSRTKVEDLLKRAETDPSAARLLKQMDDAGLLEELK